MAWRHPMQEVELVEEHLDDPADAAPSAGELWARRVRAGAWDAGRRALRYWPVGLAVAVVAVGAGVGLHVVEARREAARLAAIADVPGVLAPLDGPPVQLWRSEGAGPDGEMWLLGDVLVGARSGARGAVDAHGFDRSTGALVWSAELRVADQQSGSPETDEWGSAACVPARAGAGAGEPLSVLACVVVDEWSATPDLDGNIQPIRSDLVVLDAADGEVLARHAVAAGSTVAALDGDLVLASTDRQGNARVGRVEAVSGRPVWTYETVIPEPPDAGYQGTSAWVQVLDGRVTVSARGSSWVLTADGVPEHEGVRADNVMPVGGELMGVSYDWMSSRTDAFLLHDGGGTGDHLDVQPAWAWIDDGSLPGLMLGLTDDGGLVGVDLATSDRRWESPVRAVDSVLVVDGGIVVGTSLGLYRTDPETGEVTWTSDMLRNDGTLFTDGRTIVTVRYEAGMERQLTGVDVRSGATVWSTPLPRDVQWFTVAGGLMVGHGDPGIVVFGEE